MARYTRVFASRRSRGQAVSFAAIASFAIHRVHLGTFLSGRQRDVYDVDARRLTLAMAYLFLVGPSPR
jgi:hypothetical protein